jgi:co-chaperonin GroES (HSP10)
MCKGLILTTTLKAESESKSGLILPGEQELSDIQMVIAAGQFHRSRDENGNKVGFEPGDYIKINFQRFWKPKSKKNSLKDEPTFSDTAVEFYIPVVTIGGADYLEIDMGDVEYWWDKSVLDLK